jgi:hypothetical protein
VKTEGSGPNGRFIALDVINARLEVVMVASVVLTEIFSRKVTLLGGIWYFHQQNSPAMALYCYYCNDPAGFIKEKGINS